MGWVGFVDPRYKLSGEVFGGVEKQEVLGVGVGGGVGGRGGGWGGGGWWGGGGGGLGAGGTGWEGVD